MNLRHATLLLATALLGACNEETVGPTGAEPTQPFGRMRFVNAVPDAATSDRVNVLVEDLPFAVNLAFGVAAPAAPTLYFPVYAGSRKIAVQRTADTTVRVLDTSVPIVANTDQTVFAVKQGGVVTTVVVTDDNSLPPPDSVKLRVIHLAQSAGNVDIYVTAPNASIVTVAPTFANVAPGTVSTYLKLLRGAYQVRFTAPGSTVVILTITTPTLAAGAVRTAVSLDPQTGTALAGVTLTDR